MRVGSHIGVDLLVKNLPPVQARIVGLRAIALQHVLRRVMTVGGYQDIDPAAVDRYKAEDLPIPLWIPKLILPVGFALLFFRFAQAGWNLLTG